MNGGWDQISRLGMTGTKRWMKMPTMRMRAMVQKPKGKTIGRQNPTISPRTQQMVSNLWRGAGWLK